MYKMKYRAPEADSRATGPYRSACSNSKGLVARGAACLSNLLWCFHFMQISQGSDPVDIVLL